MSSRSSVALWSALAFCLTALPTMPAGARAGEGDEEVETEAPTDVASVKVELKQPSGKVLKYDGAKLPFGAEGNIKFTQDDHVHDVSILIERAAEGSKTISLTVGYVKDGKAVISPQTVSSEIKKREVIRIEGGVAIAITVSAKSSGKDAPKDKIVDGGGNDPLDGLE